MTVEFQNYYQILGVDKKASQEEIQKAYRKQARKYHPDVNKEKGAEDKFKKITEAYEVLKHPESRKRYDLLGNQPKSGSGPFTGGAGFDFSGFKPPPGGSGFSSFFDQFFGDLFQGQRQQASAYAKREQEASIDITLEEALLGAEKSLTIKDSQTEKTKFIKVRIPPGATQGSKIRLKGQLAGGDDLILHLNIKLKPGFHIEKYDIHTSIPIPPETAVLGGHIEIQPGEKPFRVKIPAGTQPGTLLRLKEKGLHQPRKNPGDMLVKIEIQIPKKLSEIEKNLWEQIRTIRGG